MILPDRAGDKEHVEGHARDPRRRRNEDRLELEADRLRTEQRLQQLCPPAALKSFPENEEENDARGAEDDAFMRQIKPLHAAAPTLGRQRSNRRSSRSSSATTTRPVAVKIRTPKNSVSV